MSIYIHIPFCNSICSYCDFCKFFYNEKYVNLYLESLEKEIKQNYKKEKISTIYIGGGTPSCLTKKQLEKLLQLTTYFKKADNLEFTIEINPDMELDKIELFYQYGVNRVSIGVETIHSRHLKMLQRSHTKDQIIKLVDALKEKGIFNINVDLMYALPDETEEEVREDIEFILQLNVPHISTYSLIIEPHTKLYIDQIENIEEDLDASMYQIITTRLLNHNYIHYETSNFSKEGYESKHNLVYWNNLEYYGFGIGASGYIDNVRYDNTKSLKDYLGGIYRKEEQVLSKKEKMENEFILGFRKIEGISTQDFQKKYGLDILCINVVNKLLKENKLLLENNYLKINPKYLYISNRILIDFIDLEEVMYEN